MEEVIVINGIEYVQRGRQEQQDVEHPLTIGNALFVRTVTGYYTGRLRVLTDTELLLVDAAWIADTGRWNHALTTGEVSDVEPYPDPVVISRGAVVDVTTWNHPLPRKVK